MNVDVYVHMLDNVMLTYANENMCLHWIIMHDSDPKCTSKNVKQWLTENRIEVLEWPALSPDLNLIENLWGDIKDEVA